MEMKGQRRREGEQGKKVSGKEVRKTDLIHWRYSIPHTLAFEASWCHNIENYSTEQEWARVLIPLSNWQLAVMITYLIVTVQRTNNCSFIKSLTRY